MKFEYSFYENINTIKFAEILKNEYSINIISTPMIGYNRFLFITDCGTMAQIEEAKARAKW